MQRKEQQVTDRTLVSKLLDLSSELLMKGDNDNAFTCTQAAARILAIPHIADIVQHPTARRQSDVETIREFWNGVIDSYKPPTEGEI